MNDEPSSRDPQGCRRALREIGEIAAVAMLPDSRMTDQEALRDIVAVAQWVRPEAPGARADCGAVIHRLGRMTAGVDIEALDDRAALDLFSEMLGVLEASPANVFEAQDGTPDCPPPADYGSRH